MTSLQHRSLAAYAGFYERLSPQNLDELRTLAAPGVRFKDPFNETFGIEALMAATAAMFRFGTPHFEIVDTALSDKAGYLLWRYTVDTGNPRPVIIAGMTELRFDADGRIVEHIDHWDAAEQLYERVPVLGWLLRRIKRRFQVR
jgi:steroid Delta-isomerase